MPKILLLVVAVGAFVLGGATSRSAVKQHHSLYQRAALLWTSPRAVRLRRSVRRTRSALQRAR